MLYFEIKNKGLATYDSVRHILLSPTTQIGFGLYYLYSCVKLHISCSYTINWYLYFNGILFYNYNYDNIKYLVAKWCLHH